MSINRLARTLAALQDVDDWADWSLHPLSYTTGGHYAYGWNHAQCATEEAQRRVLAGYAIRPVFYPDLARQVSYEAAGRPKGWTPEDAFDLPDGHRYVLTSTGAIVKINGVDIQHFHLGPLLAVFDGPIRPVKGLGPEFNSRNVAGLLLRGLLHALAGMVLTLSKAPKDYPGDRASACIVRAYAEGAKRGLLEPMHIPIFEEFMELSLSIDEGPPHDYMSTKYAAGVTPTVTVNETHYLKVYNGLYWKLCAYWDALPCTSFGMRVRVLKSIERMSRYMLRLEQLAPGASTKVAGVSFPDAMLGQCSEDWAELTAANLHYTDNAEVWGCRALSVAAHVLDSNVLRDACKALAAKNAGDKVWCVDFKGSVIGAVPIGGKP